MMTAWIFAGLCGIIGMCVGCITMVIITDRVNKAENERLQKEIYDNSMMYLSAVQTMEHQIGEKEKQLELKQRVMDSLNEELSRLRLLNAKLRRKEVCDD